MVLTAGFCPDRVRLVKTTYTFAVGEERRKEKNDDVDDERGGGNNKQYAVATRADSTHETAPVKIAVIYLRVHFFNSRPIYPAPYPNAAPRDDQSTNRDECRFFCRKQQCDTGCGQQKVNRPAVVPADQHLHHIEDQPSLDDKKQPSHHPQYGGFVRGNIRRQSKCR